MIRHWNRHLQGRARPEGPRPDDARRASSTRSARRCPGSSWSSSSSPSSGRRLVRDPRDGGPLRPHARHPPPLPPGARRSSKLGRRRDADAAQPGARDRPGLQAAQARRCGPLAYARATRPTFLEAITVDVDPEDTEALRDEWERREHPGAAARSWTRPTARSPGRSSTTCTRSAAATRATSSSSTSPSTSSATGGSSCCTTRARCGSRPGCCSPRASWSRACPWQLRSSEGAEDDDFDGPGRRAPSAEARAERRPSLVGTEVESSRSARSPTAGTASPGYEGRVVFVRHALPGERVRVADHRGRTTTAGSCAPTRSRSSTPRRTGSSRRARMRVRGGAAAATSSTPPWRTSGVLKAEVVARAVPAAGRARRSTCDGRGAARATTRGLRLADPGRVRRRRRRARRAARHRSHAIVPVADCLIADQRVIDSGVLDTRLDRLHRRRRGRRRPAGRRRPRRRCPDGTRRPPSSSAVEHPRVVGGVPDRRARVLAGPPRRRPDLRRRTSSTTLGPQPGEQVLDLYAGAGLFAAALADAVGPAGSVLAVEGRPARGRSTGCATPHRPAAGRVARTAASTGCVHAAGRGSRSTPTSSSSTRRAPAPAATSSRDIAALRPRADRLRRVRPGGAGAGRRIPGRGRVPAASRCARSTPSR